MTIPSNGPSGSPGLVWLTTADTALAARTANQPITYFLNLKLGSPAGATAFAGHYDATAANTPNAPYLISWQDISNEDAKTTGIVQLILLTGSGLLVLLALASVAVLVGGRMAEQSRRVGLMKAAGGTPPLVAAVLMLEHVIIGVIAAGTGLLAGWLTAPLLDGPGAGLLGTAGTPALGPGSIGAVLALALGVAIAATFVPALRAARTSTVRLLDDAARAPRRSTVAIRLSAHLPAPLLSAPGSSARRPRRLVLATASAAITASGIMAVMVLHVTNAANSPLTPNDPQEPPVRPGHDRALGHAHHPRRRQRDLHRLGDRPRHPAFLRARPSPRRHARADNRRHLGRSAPPRPRRRTARHPRGNRHLRRREERRLARNPPSRMGSP